MTKAQSHRTISKQLSPSRQRKFWGEGDAAVVVAWLNSKRRASGDVVEQIVEMNEKIPLEATLDGVCEFVRQTVARSKFVLVPIPVRKTDFAWGVEWRYGGRMDRRQALALLKVFHLANESLLWRIRRCEKCQAWFFAGYRHKRFCSKQCQVLALSESEDYRRHRRMYMRELRREERLRQERAARAARRKR